MQNKIFTKKSAFTLLELVVYMGVFSIVFIVVVQFGFNVAEANKSASSTLEIERTTTLISQHFTETFETYDEIDQLLSDVDNAERVRFVNNTSYIEYRIENSRFLVERDGVENFITKLDFSIQNLDFEYIFSQDLTQVIGLSIDYRVQSNKEERFFKEISLNLFF